MFLKEVAVELHDTLNPKLWDENSNLRPLVKDRLTKIVDKYIESSDIITKDDVIDVELLGSNASYNYTPYSDLDVHLVVNMEDVSCDPALFQLACNAERANFNKNYDFKIKGIDVELYVEDVHAGTASNGIYSLFNDEWIKFPQKITVPNYDNDEEYIALLSRWKSQAAALLDNAASAKQVQEYINNLYNLRRTSIMKDGEFGKGNLIFKELRNLGYLDNLKQKQYKLSSKELSLESIRESNIIDIFRGIDRNLEKFDKGVDWWTVSEEDAYNYGPGMSDNPNQAEVLRAQLDLSKYKIPQIKDKDINSIYTNSNLLKLLGLDLLKKDKNEVVFIDDKQNYITIKNDLNELQPFINDKLKKSGYDGLFAEFMIGTKPTTEIAIFNDSILDYDHPDWYKRNSQQNTEGVNMNKKKYRVNYLLNESFHYSIVEAENEDAADEIVFDALGEPESYDLLGVEEDKTHLIKPGNDSAMSDIINQLIIDEWEAINGYNAASVTAQQIGLEDAARLFSDLSKEEIEHVGELQELLKSFDKNTHAIANGEEEAKDKLEESFEDLDEVDKAKVVTVVDKKYRKSVDELIDDINEGKFDKYEYTVSEPTNSIEFMTKDMSNGSGKVIYRYFIDEDNGEILVYVNVS